MTLNASNYTVKCLDVSSRPSDVSAPRGTGGSCVQTVRLKADNPTLTRHEKGGGECVEALLKTELRFPAVLVNGEGERRME